MARRAGFSLIEALVVLAIGGMALALIFSIGTQAGDTGFGLGRRALDAADADIAQADVRSVIQSFLLRPPAGFVADVDRALDGEETRLAGEAVMRRSTACGPRGWRGELILAVEETPDETTVLTCQTGTRKAVLARLERGDGAFSYSSDGSDWTGTYSSSPEAFDRPNEEEWAEVYVRFAALDDEIDLVERLTSGRAETWARTDVFQ
jgi:prepilin-type N-terminal cleavage/methylation domain-containing protein